MVLCVVLRSATLFWYLVPLTRATLSLLFVVPLPGVGATGAEPPRRASYLSNLIQPTEAMVMEGRWEVRAPGTHAHTLLSYGTHALTHPLLVRIPVAHHVTYKLALLWHDPCVCLTVYAHAHGGLWAVA